MKKLRITAIFVLAAALLLMAGCSAQNTAETSIPADEPATSQTGTPDVQTPPEGQPQTVPTESGASVSAMTLAESAAASRMLDSSSFEGASVIVLSDGAATVDGAAVREYDYTWNADPTTVHDNVKDSPAEYYTGTEPSGDEAVYIAHDVIYYPELDESGFVSQVYDGETEWVYYYTAEGCEDYIFSTLPVRGTGVPTEMMHSAEEAYSNPVLHITAGGTYVLEGEWQGQIAVDVGEEESVTVILNGVKAECSVAPAFIVYGAYECCSDEETGESEVDTSAAGARVVIADGSENSFSGTNVFRILKTKFKDDGVTQKKSHKYDAAFYSCVTMEIDGSSGTLNIFSTYEGLDSELHLTINGGRINVRSDDDGINVNEDNVSVLTVNGGELSIIAGLGYEGDAVDSNGYIVINGGTVYAVANPGSDNGLDSGCGTVINGGTVVAMGSNMGGTAQSVYVDGELVYGASSGGFGGMQGGMTPPEGFGDGERPQPPEGGMQGGFPGQPPEGAPEPPDGETGSAPPAESEIPG
ncbi:MAG: carbohydrate-binding domain-containing protein [Oscillospiraceae bacterium]|nr:carbohydrate-binding domain-containing protein [Oscillospiraceae bacterium]